MTTPYKVTTDTIVEMTTRSHDTENGRVAELTIDLSHGDLEGVTITLDQQGWLNLRYLLADSPHFLAAFGQGDDACGGCGKDLLPRVETYSDGSVIARGSIGPLGDVQLCHRCYQGEEA